MNINQINSSINKGNKDGGTGYKVIELNISTSENVYAVVTPVNKME
jgi:hypothetical protein